MCREVNFTWGQAVSLYTLGVVAYVQGHLKEAGGYLNEGLRLCHAIGDPRITALCLNAASAIPYALGRYNEAEQLLQQSISLHNGKSDRFSLGTTIYHLGVLCYSRGDYAEAQTFLEESLTLFKEIGDYANIVRTLNSLGKLAFAQADYATARRCYFEALQLSREGQFFSNMLDVLAGVAELMVMAQLPEIALEIAAFLLQQPASSKDAYNRASLLLSGLSPQPLAEQAAIDCSTPGKSVDELAGKVLGWLSTISISQLQLQSSQT
jgi:tetratricopeptide (TPR) repeat protein